MAEALFREAVKERDDFEVGSAGVAAYPGSPASSATLKILAARGISADGFASRPVTKEVLESSTHVFAMTASHLAALMEDFPEFEDRFFLATEFAEIPGRGIGVDVPDPIGMGSKAYEEVAATLDVAIPALVKYIDQTWSEEP